MHFGSATRPSQRTHSAFRDRRRNYIKVLDALFSDQGTLHLALPPLLAFLARLDGPKRARSAEKPSKTLTAIRGVLRHPKRGRFHPKTALETRSKGCTKAALEQTCSAAAKSDQNDHFWHVFELVPEIIFRKSIFFFLGLNWEFVRQLLFISQEQPSSHPVFTLKIRRRGDFGHFCQNPQIIRKLLSLIKNPKICSHYLTYLLRISGFFTLFENSPQNFDDLSKFFAKS